MPELSRVQLLVYGAIAVALVLVGARWVKASGHAEDGGGVSAAGTRDGGGSEDGSFAVERTGDLVVHVAGAVRQPGVYRLPHGSRVTDAIERAGGAAAKASVDAINLAAPLADGQQVRLPSTVRPAAAGSAPGAEAAAGPVSLGSATAADLDAIEGIGPVTAAAILEFRDEHGGVASIDQLDEISGIGPTTMEALRGALQP